MTLNAVTSWALAVVKALIGLILVPFLLTRLGKTGYGVISLVGTIVGFTTLADLGLRAGLGRHLTEQLARKDTRRFNELASTGMLAYLIVGGICAAICVVFAPLLVRFFRVSEDMIPQAVFLVRWYGSVSVVLSFIGPVFGATITSNNRFDIRNYIGMGSAILQMGLLFAVLGLTKAGLYGWAYVAMGTHILAFLARRVAAYHLCPDLHIRLSEVRADAFLSLFSLGGKMFIFRVTNMVSVRADPIIITQFFGPGGVALYMPGLALPALARRFAEALRKQLHVLATGYYVTGKTKRLHAVLTQGTKYTFLVGIGVSAALVVFAEPIMLVWIGRTPIGQAYRTTAWVLVCWALVDMLSYAGGTQWAVLLGMNRLKFLVWTQVVYSVANILASIYLVGYTSLGIVGAVVPTVVINAIGRPITTVYTAWACGMSSWRYLRESYVRPMMVLLLLVGGGSGLRWWIGPATVSALLGSALMMGIMWLALTWWVGFNASDRQLFRSLILRGLGKLGRRPAIREKETIFGPENGYVHGAQSGESETGWSGDEA